VIIRHDGAAASTSAWWPVQAGHRCAQHTANIVVVDDLSVATWLSPSPPLSVCASPSLPPVSTWTTRPPVLTSAVSSCRCPQCSRYGWLFFRLGGHPNTRRYFTWCFSVVGERLEMDHGSPSSRKWDMRADMRATTRFVVSCHCLLRFVCPGSIATVAAAKKGALVSGRRRCTRRQRQRARWCAAQ